MASAAETKKSAPASAAIVAKNLEIKTLDDPRWVERLKVLDIYVFPVKYTERYYANLFPEKKHELSQIAFWGDAIIGECTCRLEPLREGKDGKFKCYIMTLGVLEAYRHCGIGSKLLQASLDQAAKDKNIEEIALHAQIGSPAVDFYTKRFGFTIKETVPKYYTDIEPADAYYLSKPNAAAQSAKKK